MNEMQEIWERMTPRLQEAIKEAKSAAASEGQYIAIHHVILAIALDHTNPFTADLIASGVALDAFTAAYKSRTPPERFLI